MRKQMIMSMQEINRSNEGALLKNSNFGYDLIQIRMLVWRDKDPVVVNTSYERPVFGRIDDLLTNVSEYRRAEWAIPVEEEEWDIVFRTMLGTSMREELSRKKVAARMVGTRSDIKGAMEWEKGYVLKNIPPEALEKYFEGTNINPSMRAPMPVLEVTKAPAVPVKVVAAPAVSGFAVQEFGVRKRLQDRGA